MRSINQLLSSAELNQILTHLYVCCIFSISLRVHVWCIFCVCMFCISSHQVVAAGVVDHPALFNHCGAFPLGVLDGLNHTHQRDVTAGARAAREQTRTHRKHRHFRKCNHFAHLNGQ